MRDQLLGCEFDISPTAFYQTNPQQTELLYQLAIDGMDCSRATYSWMPIAVAELSACAQPKPPRTRASALCCLAWSATTPHCRRTS